MEVGESHYGLHCDRASAKGSLARRQRQCSGLSICTEHANNETFASCLLISCIWVVCYDSARPCNVDERVVSIERAHRVDNVPRQA
jgi:hypothetical protein